MRPLALLVAVVGCGSAVDGDDVQRYLRDPAYRRDELVAELVNPANDYSRIRLERYGRAWERLPEWNPRVWPVTVDDRTANGAAPAASDQPRALSISSVARGGDRSALLELGEAAFSRYPAQTVDQSLTVDAAAAARDGIWIDGARIGGFVHAEMADGSSRIAYTCATCHAAVRDGRLVPGLAAASLDLGRLLSEEAHDPDPELLAWGPGRADVSSLDALEPVRIPDLRQIRYETHLQVNATVAQRGLASLALRIETLLVLAHGEILRPPREIVVGLALYLWSLAPAPPRPATTPAALLGAATFTARCSRCHAPPAFAGPPVAIDEIGSDAVGRSTSRGTGRWRVPSLQGVGSRGMLFHDGSLADPADVLDPARLSPGYTGGRRPGPVTEHRFGLDLDAAVRADLVAYLRTL